MSTGILNSTTLNGTTDFVAKSFASMITRLMPNGQAPLFGMTAMLPSETALQVEHGFFTKTMIFPSMNLDAAVADGAATTFTVASTNNLVPGMLMRAQSTGEIVLVNQIVSSTSVTVTRGVGTVAAAAIANDVNFYQVGNAYEESSLRPNALQINPVRITNLTQIFRNTWALSGTAQATQVIAGESTVAESRQECAAFHAADIEKALFWGQKSQGTRNGQPFRTMDGLLRIISDVSYYPPGSTANITTAGATTNYTQLEAALDPVFNQVTDPKAGNQRILFVGSQARKVINNIGRLNSTYYIQNGATNYGLQFGSFNIARGSFNMIEHPLFNSNADWAKMAVAVDLSSFRVAYLGGRKTKKEEFNTDGKAVDNGIDAVGGTLTTEMTCVIKNPPANAAIFNLTAAAAG